MDWCRNQPHADSGCLTAYEDSVQHRPEVWQ